jgi:hypothetical protein
VRPKREDEEGGCEGEGMATSMARMGAARKREECDKDETEEEEQSDKDECNLKKNLLD